YSFFAKITLSDAQITPIMKHTMNKEVHDMNINFTAYNDMAEAVNLRLRSESNVNREVREITPAKTDTEDLALREKELELKRKIQEDTTMDVTEVKNFLFMLIGAEIKVKPESGISGSVVNRMA
ncbi:MAG TPA: hypothetical protein PLT13_15670, partial [Spirochaetota bacterium]|nr:hypothetical protein [Spirochaetota bacterium]HPR39034.1 hypothetical protein [Spirochaetota bacterium]